MSAVPWARPDLFLQLPEGAGPWGVARINDKGTIIFEQVPDAEALRRRLREDRSVYYAWAPGDEHLRPIYEIAEAAKEIEVRGAEELSRDLRQSLPWLALTVAALAGTVSFWPGRQYQLFAVLFLMFVVLPVWRRGVEGAFEAWRSLRRLRRDPVRWRALESSRIRFASWSGQHQSRVAIALVCAFVATYVVTVWTGDERAMKEFELHRGKVLAGEWWRLLSCVFLHGGPPHIFFNCAAALSLAGIARSLVSEAHILFVFVASAVAGSVASAILLGKPSIGASGAILGWGGLLLGMALAHKELRPTGLISNLMRWVVALALIGIAGMRFIDNAAHAGGLVMGLALGLFLARDRSRPLPVRSPLGRGGFIVLSALCAAPWLWMVWVLVRARVLGG